MTDQRILRNDVTCLGYFSRAAERAETWAAKIEAEGGDIPDERPMTKIGESLVAQVASGNPDRLLRIMIRLVEPPGETTTTKLQRAVAAGEVDTKSDFEVKRLEILAQKRVRILKAQAPVFDAIVALGGNVVSMKQNMYGLNADLPARHVLALAARPDIARLDFSEEGKGAAVAGDDVNRGSQIRPYNANDWDGEMGNGTADDITVAVLDDCGIDDEHLGFNEDSSGGPRIRGRYRCESSCTDSGSSNCTGPDANGCCTCSKFNYSGSEDSCSATPAHNTIVSGVIFGDLRDGQDPNISTVLMRDNRSGYAREAQAYVYDNWQHPDWFDAAMDHVIGRSPRAHVMNVSWNAGDATCSGETALSMDTNDVFEDGTLPVIAAGNNGNSNSNDCTVGEPGSAISAFTVGSHGSVSVTGGESNVRNDPVSWFTARGGVASEGKGRTIISMTAFGCREQMFDRFGGYTSSACGTSISAPTISAVAVNLVDFWKTNIDNAIDDPGIQFVNLLLMGDRTEEGGTRRTELFSSLWGAGRIKARKWDSDGMDAPSVWSSYWTCIDHGACLIS